MKRDTYENTTVIDCAKDAGLYEAFGVVLKETMETLPEREYKVLYLFYGFHGGKRFTVKEIGREFNVSDDRIVQIKKSALTFVEWFGEPSLLFGFVYDYDLYRFCDYGKTWALTSEELL